MSRVSGHYVRVGLEADLSCSGLDLSGTQTFKEQQVGQEKP